MTDAATKELASFLEEDTSPAWEYDTITFLVGTETDNNGTHEIWVAKNPFQAANISPKPIKEVLNEIGKDGWDIGPQIGSNTLIFIIKRPIPYDRRPTFPR